MLFLVFLFFCIEVAIYSSSHSIYYCIFPLLAVLLSLLWYRSFWYFFLIITAFVWSFCSVYFYDLTTSHDFHKNDNVVLSWIVLGYGKNEQLVFEDSNGYRWLVKNKQQVFLWEQYLLQGKINMACSANGDGLWLLWEFDYEKWLWMKWFAWTLSNTKWLVSKVKVATLRIIIYGH